MEWMEVSHANLASILTAIRARFGNEVEDRKTVNFIGGYYIRPQGKCQYCFSGDIF